MMGGVMEVWSYGMGGVMGGGWVEGWGEGWVE